MYGTDISKSASAPEGTRRQPKHKVTPPPHGRRSEAAHPHGRPICPGIDANKSHVGTRAPQVWHAVHATRSNTSPGGKGKGGGRETHKPRRCRLKLEGGGTPTQAAPPPHPTARAKPPPHAQPGLSIAEHKFCVQHGLAFRKNAARGCHPWPPRASSLPYTPRNPTQPLPPRCVCARVRATYLANAALAVSSWRVARRTRRRACALALPAQAMRLVGEREGSEGRGERRPPLAPCRHPNIVSGVTPSL